MNHWPSHSTQNHCNCDEAPASLSPADGTGETHPHGELETIQTPTADSAWQPILFGRLPLNTLRRWAGMQRKKPAQVAHAVDPMRSMAFMSSIAFDVPGASMNSTSSNPPSGPARLFRISGNAAGISLLELLMPDSLDTMEIDALIASVMSDLEGKSQAPWIVDLSQVHYMGSSMLGLMINIREKIKQAGGRLALCGLSPQLLRIFQTCCLERLFTICKTREDAMKFLKR